MQETRVQSRGQEDPLEEDMAAHSSILARKISMDGGARGLQSMGCKDSDATEQLSAHTHIHQSSIANAKKAMHLVTSIVLLLWVVTPCCPSQFSPYMTLDDSVKAAE